MLSKSVLFADSYYIFSLSACLYLLCWFPYMNDTVIVLLSLSKMRGIYCIPLCQLTVVVPRIPNLSHMHVSSSLIPASYLRTVCEYRLSSLRIASLLSLFRPFFYPSPRPSPSLFPLRKAVRSCRRKGCQSSVLRSWSQVSIDRWDAALSKFPCTPLYVLLRCYKQWHTLGNDTLFLSRSNVDGRILFFRRGAV